MGTNTDPYQKAEGKYHLTQGIVRVLAEAANPFSILTKSTLVLRDLGLLVEAAARTQVRLDLSIGTLDRDVWRLTEPGTPPPDKRLEAVRRLNEAGVPLRRADRAGAARAVGLRRAVARGGRGVRRGRRRLGHADRSPPAPRGPRALPGMAQPTCGPISARSMPNASAEALTSRRPSNVASPRSSERWAAALGAVSSGARRPGALSRGDDRLAAGAR